MTLLWSGLALGAVYALVAIGYNIVYISSKAFNFAHAQLMMLGTFVAYTGLVTLDLPVIVVVIMAMLVVTVVAGLEEVLAIRPVSDHRTLLVTTLGVAILLDGVTQLLWGRDPLSVPFTGGNNVVEILGGRTYPAEIALLVVAVVLVVALSRFTKMSRYGLALVGISEDEEAAKLKGINVRAFIFAAFLLSGAIAGLLGVFVGPKTFAVATLGTSLALKGFVALAIGGFGSLYGALIGGLSVGVIEAVATYQLGAQYSNLTVFLVLIVILMIRPAGLFGKVKERVV
ncbi:branched-chain amino acid ABC transporter permease [Rhodococcus sp. NPDC058514]|uniref:branched-chain amino acid ABC transporter permease n=1 Tax=unclassified Rhodococcus (in: high G+C Gram-positive bacteria) TaxID=192944 RepID=UPI00365272A3